jgi:hypothetical protein
MNKLQKQKPDLSEALAQVPRLVRDLYAIASEFETLLAGTGRKFSPFHLVGNLGEVIAAYKYDLTLLNNFEPLHDAQTEGGLKIQIKTIQGISRVALRGQPDHLIVLQLNKEGEATEIFNGPSVLVWERFGSRKCYGQRSVALSTLRSLMDHVPQTQRVRLRT